MLLSVPTVRPSAPLLNAVCPLLSTRAGRVARIVIVELRRFHALADTAARTPIMSASAAEATLISLIAYLLCCLKTRARAPNACFRSGRKAMTGTKKCRSDQVRDALSAAPICLTETSGSRSKAACPREVCYCHVVRK